MTRLPVSLTQRRLEAAIGVAIILLGAFALWQALRMPPGTVALPGPGMLPAVHGSLIIIAGAAIAVRSLWSGAAAEETVPLGHNHIALVLLALFASALLLERIGFVATGTLFLFVQFWVLGGITWWRAMLASLVVTLCCRYFFSDLLGVRLPPFPIEL